MNTINPDRELTITRSCTEFELALGPSDKWDDLEIEWAEKESVLDEWVWRATGEPPTQHELIKQAVRNRMMYWAHEHGDFTYKHFNDNNELVHTFVEERRVPISPAVTYNP